MRTQPLSGVSLILVEDDADAREVLEFALTAQGAYVRTAATADEALALFKAAPSAILLTDITMPGRDGLWLLQQIRELPEASGVPAIALTGRAFPHERESIEAAGFDAQLLKPVDSDEMVRVITSLITA